MEYLGLFCLGVFAGAVTVTGLHKIQGQADWRQVLLAFLPVLLSGAAMVFVDRFRYSPAMGAFPLGLVASLLWAHVSTALDHLKSSDVGPRVVGLAHLAVAVGLVAGAVPLVVVPAVEQVLAESAMSRETRIDELHEARRRANWGLLARATGGAGERTAAASAPPSSASGVVSPTPTSAPATSAAASR